MPLQQPELLQWQSQTFNPLPTRKPQLPLFQLGRHLLKSDLSPHPLNSNQVLSPYSSLFCFQHTEQGEQARDIWPKFVCRGLVLLRYLNIFGIVMSSIKDWWAGLGGKLLLSDNAILGTWGGETRPPNVPHCLSCLRFPKTIPMAPVKAASAKLFCTCLAGFGLPGSLAWIQSDQKAQCLATSRMGTRGGCVWI